MKNRLRVSHFVSLGVALFFAVVLLAQDAPERTLVVNGKPAGAVVEMDGHTYVDLETLAKVTKGTLSFEEDRILLTFPPPANRETAPPEQPAPSANGDTPPPEPAPPPPPPPPPPGLSRDFARLAIAELAEMREWRGAVGTILSYGVPAVGTWPQDYRDRAEADLNQVSVAATTDPDHEALQLLQNEFSNLDAWASGVVATRQAMNATQTVNPNVVQNDQTLAKISTCSRFLSSMLVSGTFADDPSCH